MEKDVVVQRDEAPVLQGKAERIGLSLEEALK